MSKGTNNLNDLGFHVGVSTMYETDSAPTQEQTFIPVSRNSNGYIETQIVDANSGDPIVGANVYLKNYPSIGATTDATGVVRLAIPVTADTVIFSHVGYKNSERKINTLGSMISLQPDVITNQEVVLPNSTSKQKVAPVLLGVAVLFGISLLATRETKPKKKKSKKKTTVTV